MPPNLENGFGSLSKECFQEIVYTVYATRDVGTLQTLCLVSRAVSQMAEEIIYDRLEVVSTNNLGRLVNISTRQKKLIKSLKISDRTPTLHTNPTLIWQFISSLPNLEDLDIQYTVLPFSPPSNFHLPNLLSFRFRIISPIHSSLNTRERLDAIRQQPRIDGPVRPTLPSRTLPREHPEFISLIASSMPVLQTLSVLLIGPFEGIQKVLSAQMEGKKLEDLYAIEVIVAEPLLESIPEVVEAFVGYDGGRTRLKHLSVITKHQRMTCSLPVPDPRSKQVSFGYLVDIAIPSLERIYILVDRIVCDRCKLHSDQRLDQCYFPNVAQFHKQIHIWCNTLTQIQSFKLQVRLKNHDDGNHQSDGDIPTRDEHEVIYHYCADWEFRPRDDGKTLQRDLRIVWSRKVKHWSTEGPLGNLTEHPYECQRVLRQGELWEQGAYQNKEPLADVLFEDGQIGGLAERSQMMGNWNATIKALQSHMEPSGARITFLDSDGEEPQLECLSHARDVLREAGLRLKGDGINIIQGDEVEVDEKKDDGSSESDGNEERSIESGEFDEAFDEASYPSDEISETFSHPGEEEVDDDGPGDASGSARDSDDLDEEDGDVDKDEETGSEESLIGIKRG